MTPFTLCLAYFDNPLMLDEHIKTWMALPVEIRKLLSVVIVDDGSPRWPAENELLGLPMTAFGAANGIKSLEVYRIDVDINWNQDAARNIAVKHAPEGWLLLTDMDHIVPEKTWSLLMTAQLHHKTAYRFERVTAPHMTSYKPHCNSYAMTSKTFWKVGGYDERLAGNYGSDGDLLNRIRGEARLDQLSVPLVRVPREHIADASTTTLTRKNPEDKRRINEIIKERNSLGLKPLHFQFPYHRVL